MKKQAVLTAVASLLTLASVAVLPAFAQDTGGSSPTPTQREEFSRTRRGSERGHEWHGKGDWRDHRGHDSQRYGYGSYGKDMYGKDRYRGSGSSDKGSYGSSGNYGKGSYDSYGNYGKGGYGNYGKGGYGNYGYGYGSPRMSR